MAAGSAGSPLGKAQNAAMAIAAYYHSRGMGLEAQCTVRVGKKNGSGKALLEEDALVFRGTLRLQIPFDRVRDALVEGNDLVVRTSDQEARFELGAEAAQRWLHSIREPKALFEKLDLQPQSRVAVVDVQDGPFLSALRERSATLAEGRVPQGATVIFFGVESREALRKIPILRARMPETGILWVVRPKGSKVITESDVFETLRSAGLVDTKVVAFSRTHTAHKAVIPVELRGKVAYRPPIVSLPPPELLPVAAARKPAPAKKAVKRTTKPAKKNLGTKRKR
jgi:hypothetical protein